MRAHTSRTVEFLLRQKITVILIQMIYHFIDIRLEDRSARDLLAGLSYAAYTLWLRKLKFYSGITLRKCGATFENGYAIHWTIKRSTRQVN